MSVWPRRPCPVCSRPTAIAPWGIFMRHDEPNRVRRAGAPLISCGGSLRQAPMEGGVQLELIQETLWDPPEEDRRGHRQPAPTRSRRFSR